MHFQSINKWSPPLVVLQQHDPAPTVPAKSVLWPCFCTHFSPDKQIESLPSLIATFRFWNKHSH